MKRSIVFSVRRWQAVPAAAQAAEASGFSRVWTTEGPKVDSLVRSTALAMATKTIGIGTGIALGFARHPMALGGAAADLSLISGGRFTLGIGAGTRGVRRQYGLNIEKAAPWLEEVVSVVRQACGSDGVSFDGEYVKAEMPAARLIGVPQAPIPQIYGAAVNAIMAQRVAKCCDGLALLSIGLAQPYFEDVIIPAFRKGRERADKDPMSGGLACWCVTAVDPDREKARLMARRQLAFYFSTPSYRAPAQMLGFDAHLDKLQTVFAEMKSLDWNRLADCIPDEMVDAFIVAGTPSEVVEKLRRLEARLAPLGVDELALQLPGVNMDDAEVEALIMNVIATCAPDSARGLAS